LSTFRNNLSPSFSSVSSSCIWNPGKWRHPFEMSVTSRPTTHRHIIQKTWILRSTATCYVCLFVCLLIAWMSISLCTVNMLQLTTVYVNPIQYDPFEEKETALC
jgi:hypothetical protein